MVHSFISLVLDSDERTLKINGLNEFGNPIPKKYHIITQTPIVGECRKQYIHAETKVIDIDATIHCYNELDIVNITQFA